MKATQDDISNSLDSLRRFLREGDTVYTRTKHVSRSGMTRIVDVYVFRARTVGDREAAPMRLTWSAAVATKNTYSRQHEGIRIGGCGFSAGDHIVRDISYALFGKGGALTHRDF